MDAASNLSKNLHAIRSLRRLSQVEFSKELGISKSTLQEIEAGSSPNLDTVDCIAQHLGLPACALVSDVLPPGQISILIQIFQRVSWYSEWSRPDQLRFLRLVIRLARLMEQNL